MTSERKGRGAQPIVMFEPNGVLHRTDKAGMKRIALDRLSSILLARGRQVKDNDGKTVPAPEKQISASQYNGSCKPIPRPPAAFNVNEMTESECKAILDS